MKLSSKSGMLFLVSLLLIGSVAQLNAQSLKNSVLSNSKKYLYNTGLLANRLCDSDVLLAWPPLARFAGYDFDQAVELFMQVNAGRLVFDVIMHQFDQQNRARDSLVYGSVIKFFASIRKWV